MHGCLEKSRKTYRITLDMAGFVRRVHIFLSTYSPIFPRHSLLHPPTWVVGKDRVPSCDCAEPNSIYTRIEGILEGVSGNLTAEVQPGCPGLPNLLVLRMAKCVTVQNIVSHLALWIPFETRRVRATRN